MITVSMGTFPTTFKVAVRHASAVRKATDNVICTVTDDAGTIGIGEGCPRHYVTGETNESAREFLASHAQAAADAADVDGLDGLKRWMAEHESTIDANPAAFCAIELALLDLLARRADVPVEALLGLAPLEGTFRYTAVLGDNRKLIYALLLQRYLFRGFEDFKLKLSGDLSRDRSKLKRLRRRGSRVRVDANNLWQTPGPCIDHLRALDYDFFGIEEPLQANDLAGFQEIAETLDMPIILDESGLRAETVSTLPGDASNWILNCRVSKMGGLLRAVAVIEAAGEVGVPIVVGAQVGETSILSRAGVTAAWAAGAHLVGQEGAFGTYLLEQDLTDPVIQFNRSGRLRVGHEIDANVVGLGLRAESEKIEG